MSKIITQSKFILGGTPVFQGTRVPIQTLIDYLETGSNLQEFLEDFPSVKRSQALCLLEQLKKNLLAPYELAA